MFAARFAGSTSPVTAPFGLASQDRNWAELSAGLTFAVGGVDLSVGADTTVGRKDVENQAYRGSVTFRF